MSFPKDRTGSVVAGSVSVIIPTFRRSDGLDRAMASVLIQTALSDTPLSIIVCDNSPEASARAQVAALAAIAPIAIIYVHEPRTGVANARNAAVEACDAEFIAFLDDDEEAPAGWLSALLATQAAFGADVVFGPVTARLQDADATFPAYFETFFSRTGPDQSQRLE
ncbi:MAG: glycosyltransferase family 2 protein, partial [Asticcacaulis sp.]|nr:glycosyltransferase family 2 protein [Asticcacaulis sp.]